MTRWLRSKWLNERLSMRAMRQQFVVRQSELSEPGIKQSTVFALFNKADCRQMVDGSILVRRI